MAAKEHDGHAGQGFGHRLHRVIRDKAKVRRRQADPDLDNLAKLFKTLKKILLGAILRDTVDKELP